jgi:hypothetical protein
LEGSKTKGRNKLSQQALQDLEKIKPEKMEHGNGRRKPQHVINLRQKGMRLFLFPQPTGTSEQLVVR